MTSMYKYIAAAAVLLATLTGCEKYVDIKTQGSLVASQTVNYRYLLNNPSTFQSTARLPDISSDDINITDSAQQAQLLSVSSYVYFINAYTWQSPFYALSTDDDVEWTRMYNNIYNCNVVLDEVPASTGATDSVRNELMGEALVHRADAYLTLVNMYAKPYAAATAAADPGVPLLLKPVVSGELARASVQAVYGQLLADLKKAIPWLPVVNTYNTLPCKTAAYALLARAYLLSNDYSNAGKYADSALLLQSTVNDLQNITAAAYPKGIVDPEIILSKQAYTGAGFMPTAFRLSDTLLSLLGTKDLRYALFTAPASSYGATYTGRFFYRERIGSSETRYIGPSVPEMMLIKAEALARSGDYNGAVAMLNNLRKKRFKAADYTDLSAATANDALVLVIKEREREFFCRMLRWFDMRRLNGDPLFTRTVTRSWQGKTYSLAPGSNRYVFPIAEYVRSFNPGIAQNP